MLPRIYRIIWKPRSLDTTTCRLLGKTRDPISKVRTKVRQDRGPYAKGPWGNQGPLYQVSMGKPIKDPISSVLEETKDPLSSVLKETREPISSVLGEATNPISSVLGESEDPISSVFNWGNQGPHIKCPLENQGLYIQCPWGNQELSSFGGIQNVYSRPHVLRPDVSGAGHRALWVNVPENDLSTYHLCICSKQ